MNANTQENAYPMRRRSAIPAAISQALVLNRKPMAMPTVNMIDELDDVRSHVREDPPRDDGGAPHRQRAEAVDQALLQVLGESQRGYEAAEDHRLHDDSGHQEVDVVERLGVDCAPEDEDEEQHEHDRLDREADQEIGLALNALHAALGKLERVAGGVPDGVTPRPPSRRSDP